MHIEENKTDDIVFFLGFNVFYNLKNKDALLKFIEKYPEEVKKEFENLENLFKSFRYISFT